MIYFIILFSILISFLIVQATLGFPLISKISERNRKKHLIAMQKIIEENKMKIQLMDIKLAGENDIRNYILLNRYDLPNDEDWRILLPNMIKDLLEIGWTTEMPIYTKYKHGEYQIHISNENQEKNFWKIIHHYEEKHRKMK